MIDSSVPEPFSFAVPVELTPTDGTVTPMFVGVCGTLLGPLPPPQVKLSVLVPPRVPPVTVAL